MNRNKRELRSSRRKSCGTDGGFTFLEVMVAMFLVALLGVVLWSGLRSAQGSIGRIGTVSSSTATLIQLDRALRRYAGSIRVPFWEGSLEIRNRSGELAIPYFEGRREQRLLLLTDAAGGDDQVRLILAKELDPGGSREQLLVLGPFASLDWTVLEDEGGAPWGVQVTAAPREGKGFEPLVIVTRFGGQPF
jgi:prepilin-type N-terminal cleavage/methylation domain-containing protein